MKRGLALPFYGAVGFLALVLVAEWLPGAEPPPASPAAAPHAKPPADTSGDTRDAGEWADTVLARPLFAIGRRPPKNGEGPHLANAAGIPRLSGIMITSAGRRAFFTPDGGKPIVLAEGALLEGCTIRAIHADSVIVGTGGDTSQGGRASDSDPKCNMVLRLRRDANRVGMTLPLPQFPQPGINPGFMNPGFNPGVPGQPGFPMQQPFVPPQPVQPANEGDEQGAQPQPAPPAFQPPFPGPRGPGMPRERQ